MAIVIVNRLENVLKEGVLDSELTKNHPTASCEKDNSQPPSFAKRVLKKLVIAGGVAANRRIFSHLKSWAEKHDLAVVTPPISLCTDNAAMVAWCGLEKLRLGKVDDLNFKPKARWDLSENS